MVASRGTLTTTSLRNAGSVVPSVCVARTLTIEAVSSIVIGRRSNCALGSWRSMAISASALSQPSMRTLPIVISIVSDFPAGSATTRVCVSTSALRATVDKSASDVISAAARTIHTRGLYWRHMRSLAIALFVVVTAIRASAQSLPEEPISIAGGHVIVGAEITATMAPDDPGFFNYTSYEFSALRNLRMGVSAEVRANDYVQLLTEVRFDQGRVLEAYGLFLRVRPWPARRFDIQAGRIPPTFGAMTRTAYGSGNLLIGQPLAYQYLTSIRPDALPGHPDDLLRMRGRGWLSRFPVGHDVDAPGLPIVNTSRWDTGVQAHGVTGMIEWTGSVSAGSLSDPRFRDNNAGRQLAGRAVARPTAATVFGVSASRGAWLNDTLETEVAGVD